MDPLIAMLPELPLPDVPAVPLADGEPLGLPELPAPAALPELPDPTLPPAPAPDAEPAPDDPALPDAEPAPPEYEPDVEPLIFALVSMNWLPPIRELPLLALPDEPVVPLVPVAPAVLPPPPCRHPVTVTVRLPDA